MRIGLGLNLSPYYNLGPTPFDINEETPGIAIRHSADSLTLNDGDSVLLMPDLIGDGDASGSLAPIFKTGIKNGLPVTRWSGAEELYLQGSVGPLSKNVGHAALFVVFKPTSATIKSDILFVGDGSYYRGRLGLVLSENGRQGQFTMFGRRDDDDSAQFLSGGTIVPNTWYILSCIVDYATAHAELLLNEDVIAETDTFQTAGNVSNTNSLAMIIGSNGGDAFMRGDIADDIFCFGPQVTRETAIKVISALNNKWDVY